MAFIKLAKKKKVRKQLHSDAVAYFRTGNRKEGSFPYGSIIFSNSLPLKIGDYVNLFVDSDNGSIAIKKIKYVGFRVSQYNSSDWLAVRSVALLGIAEHGTEFQLTECNSGDYDLILTPINQVYEDLKKTFSDALSGNIN